MDPVIASFLENTPEWPGTRTQSISELREAVRSASTAFPPLAVELASIEDRAIEGPAGEILVRIYTPTGAGPFPLVTYFHGGGYATGDLDTQDMIARALAAGAPAVVVSVDYRLAPENPFPAGPEDCYAATVWAAGNAESLNAHAASVVTAGDSAGANLAAAVAVMANEANSIQIRAQLLFYGSFGYPEDTTDSMREFSDGPILTADDVHYFWELYLPDTSLKNDPKASPSYYPTLEAMPPTFHGSAELDPSRDYGERFMEKLAAAGVKTHQIRYPGMVHGFVSWLGIVPTAEQAVNDACAFLRETLDTHQTGDTNT